MDAQQPEKVGLAELIVAKQRNGPTGSIKLAWAKDITRFRDYTAQIAPSDYGGGGHFQAAARTGPVAGHRDGGGPDAGDLPI